MGQRAAEITDFDRAIAKSLQTRFDESGLTYEEIAEKSGVPKSTANKTIRGMRAATINEVEALARALGTRASIVFAEAESNAAVALHDPAPVVPPAHATQAYIDEAHALAERALAAGYGVAAKHHEPDPFDDVGEEPQTFPEDDEF